MITMSPYIQKSIFALFCHVISFFLMFIRPPVHPFVCSCVCPSNLPPFCLSVCLFVFSSLCSAFLRSVCYFVFHYIRPFVRRYVCAFVVCPYVRLSSLSFIRPSVYPFVCPSFRSFTCQCSRSFVVYSFRPFPFLSVFFVLVLSCPSVCSFVCAFVIHSSTHSLSVCSFVGGPKEVRTDVRTERTTKKGIQNEHTHVQTRTDELTD